MFPPRNRGHLQRHTPGEGTRHGAQAHPQIDGCYHGHGDSLLVAAGSGPATLGLPDSPGVPEETASLTLSVPFNDLGLVASAFEKFKDLACVIVEPVAGNMGLVPPVPGFLEGLREITRKNGLP